MCSSNQYNIQKSIIPERVRGFMCFSLSVQSRCVGRKRSRLCALQPSRNFKLKLTSKVVKLTEKLGNKWITESIKYPAWDINAKLNDN